MSILARSWGSHSGRHGESLGDVGLRNIIADLMQETVDGKARFCSPIGTRSKDAGRLSMGTMLLRQAGCDKHVHASKQASKQASQPASKQASKQAQQASKQASKQASSQLLASDGKKANTDSTALFSHLVCLFVCRITHSQAPHN